MKFKIYYYFHFGIIFIISITSVIKTFLEYRDYDKIELTVLNYPIQNLLQNPLYHSYTIFTGTNTGYGFYGINVSTYKYFDVELYDKEKNLIRKTKTFGFKNQNNLSRFEVFASRMANFIVENKDLSKEENSEELQVRKLYVNKIFKYIGLIEAKKTKNCKLYKVTSYTLLPSNIWIDANYNKTKKIGVYESIEFTF